MTVVNEYDVGARVHVTAVLTDPANGQAVDPTTVTFRVEPPDGPAVTYTVDGTNLVRDSAGHYSGYFTVTRPGFWAYRIEGSGGFTAAAESGVQVRPTSF